MLTFRALAPRQSENALIILQYYPVVLSHRRSTTVCLETYPLSKLKIKRTIEDRNPQLLARFSSGKRLDTNY